MRLSTTRQGEALRGAGYSGRFEGPQYPGAQYLQLRDGDAGGRPTSDDVVHCWAPPSVHWAAGTTVHPGCAFFDGLASVPGELFGMGSTNNRRGSVRTSRLVRT